MKIFACGELTICFLIAMHNENRYQYYGIGPIKLGKFDRSCLIGVYGFHLYLLFQLAFILYYLVFIKNHKRPFQTLGTLGDLGSYSPKRGWILIAKVHWKFVEPIMAALKLVLTFFELPGEKPGDPCLARIYYCLWLAGDKASASTLLYKA